MLNKQTLLVMVVTVVVMCSAVFFKNVGSKQDALFAENVEALAQEEGAIIICSAGDCGRCFEEKKAWPFYSCIWTGYQSDYCECDKTGWIFLP